MRTGKVDGHRQETMFVLAPLLALAAAAAAKILYAGVAESGGEFGVFSGTATPGTGMIIILCVSNDADGVCAVGLPGRFGVDYAFINKSTVDIFVDQDKVCY